MLELEFVYGFNGKLPHMVHWLADGRIAYGAGATVVLMDVVDRFQRYYFGHDDQITA